MKEALKMNAHEFEQSIARLRVRGVLMAYDRPSVDLLPWTRLTVTLCTIGVATATVFASVPALLVLVPIAIFGAVSPVHPFDHFYNSVIRGFTGTKKLPPNGAPARFACAIAMVWFSAMALAFQTELCTLGYVMGGVMVAIGSLVTFTDFCIPATIYQYLFGDRDLIKSTAWRAPQNFELSHA